MPTIRVNGTHIDYEITGSGQQAIVFAHGFLFDKHMYDQQVSALSARYTCIAYDHRGQGRSEHAASGYDMNNITEDARALIEALDCAPCHFVGLSMGGFVGLRLAIRYPHLLQSLVLLETSADPEPPEAVRRYKLLATIGRWLSLRLVVDRVLSLMFGQNFLNDPAREAEKKRWRDFMVAFDKPTLPKALAGVTGRASVYEQLGQIAMPVLLIFGDQDKIYSRAVGKRMQEKIPAAELVMIPGAGHSSPVEEPAAVTAAIASFLDSQSG